VGPGGEDHEARRLQPSRGTVRRSVSGAAMEIAAVVRSVRLLDALAYPPDRGALPEEAEASTVASDTVRALIVAGPAAPQSEVRAPDADADAA